MSPSELTGQSAFKVLEKKILQSSLEELCFENDRDKQFHLNLTKMFYIHLTQRYYQYALKLIFLAFFLVLAPFWIFQLWNKDEDSSGAFQLEDILNHCNIEKPNSKQVRFFNLKSHHFFNA